MPRTGAWSPESTSAVVSGVGSSRWVVTLAPFSPRRPAARGHIGSAVLFHLTRPFPLAPEPDWRAGNRTPQLAGPPTPRVPGSLPHAGRCAAPEGMARPAGHRRRTSAPGG